MGLLNLEERKMQRVLVISFLFFWLPETTQKNHCSHYDVAEYLNISSKQNLFLYTMPKKKWEEPLEVMVDFMLLSILSVQEKLQVVTFYFWIYTNWVNDFIFWDPVNFCNISHIMLPSNLFWIPEVYIEERVDEEKCASDTTVRLTHNGSIAMIQAYRITSSCNLDVHAFPFDEQKCLLTLTTTLPTDKELLLRSIKSSRQISQEAHKNYLTNGEWRFMDVKIRPHMISYEADNYSAIVYEITMKRRASVYVLVLIMPTSILFFLDMAITFSFASPEEKIAFKVTLILQVSLLSMILNDRLPTTSDHPPTLGLFFSGMFIFMVLGILANVFILYLRKKKPNSLSLKENKCCSRFLRKEKKGSEGSTTDFGEEIPNKCKKTAEFPLSEKDSADRLRLLEHLSVELQQIKKHLALEECQDALTQDKMFLPVEKGLYIIHFILSVAFLIFIVVEWSQ